MRKIIVFNMISVDGYFASADDSLAWHVVDTEFNLFAIEQLASAGTLMLGRITYDLFVSYWPTALASPDISPEDRTVAEQLENIHKIVFSKTLEEATWNNTDLKHEITPDSIQHLKEQEGKDIYIFGSGTVVEALTKLRLVDEYRLMVNPVILGEGKPLFKDIGSELKLQLVSERTFASGNVLLTYSKKNM